MQCMRRRWRQVVWVQWLFGGFFRVGLGFGGPFGVDVGAGRIRFLVLVGWSLVS